MMPVQHQSAASEDNSYLETDAENTAAEKASRSCVGTPKSIGAFPGSNRTSFEGQQGYPSPTSQTTGIHRPVALKRGHLELQSNQLVWKKKQRMFFMDLNKNYIYVYTDTTVHILLLYMLLHLLNIV